MPLLPAIFPSILTSLSASNWTDEMGTSLVVGNDYSGKIGDAQDTTFIRAGDNTDSQVFFELDDMPANFGSMVLASVGYSVRCRIMGWTNDNVALYAQVFAADETTPLTNEKLVGDQATLAKGDWDTEAGFFGGDVAGDKATWDGAKVRLRYDHQNVMGGDSNLFVDSAFVQISGTYNASGPALIPITLAGNLNMNPELSRSYALERTVAGSLSFALALQRKLARSYELIETLAWSLQVNKQMPRTVSGNMTLTSALTRRLAYQRLLAGAVAPLFTISRSMLFGRTSAADLNSNPDLTRRRMTLRTEETALALTPTLGKGYSLLRAVTGVLSPALSWNKGVGRTLAEALNFTNVMSRLASRSRLLAGSLSTQPALAHEKISSGPLERLLEATVDFTNALLAEKSFKKAVETVTTLTPTIYAGTGEIPQTTRRQRATAVGNNLSTATFSQAPVVGNLLLAHAFARTGAVPHTINGENVAVGATTTDGWTKVIEQDVLPFETNHRRATVVWIKVAGEGESTQVQANGTPHLLTIEELEGPPTFNFIEAIASHDGTATTWASAVSSGTTGEINAATSLLLGILGVRLNNLGVNKPISWTNGLADHEETDEGGFGRLVGSAFDQQTTQGTKEIGAAPASNSSVTGVSVALLVFELEAAAALHNESVETGLTLQSDLISVGLVKKLVDGILTLVPSIEAGVAVPKEILLVIGDAANPVTADTILRGFLEDIGYNVTYRSDETADDTTGFDGVVIAESVTAATLGSKYASAAIPVVIHEGDTTQVTAFKLATSGGTSIAETTMTILDDTHPIADGPYGSFTGDVQIFPVAGSGWLANALGVAPGGNLVARTQANTTRHIFVAFDQGAELTDGSFAPAKRAFAGIRTGGVPQLNADGQSMMKNTYVWAFGVSSGGGGLTQQALDLTQVITPSLARVRTALREHSGSIAFVGAIERRISKTSAVSLTLLGSMGRWISKTNVGSVIFVPTLARGGAVTRDLETAATLTAQLVRLKLMKRAHDRSVTLTPTMTRALSLRRLSEATITLVSSINRRISKLNPIGITLTPDLARFAGQGKTFSGDLSLSPALTLVKHRFRAVAASMPLTATLTRLLRSRRELDQVVSVAVGMERRADRFLALEYNMAFVLEMLKQNQIKMQTSTSLIPSLTAFQLGLGVFLNVTINFTVGFLGRVVGEAGNIISATLGKARLLSARVRSFLTSAKSDSRLH